MLAYDKAREDIFLIAPSVLMFLPMTVRDPLAAKFGMCSSPVEEGQL